MGLTLILAEKPNQAKAYSDAFKNTIRKDGYIEVDDNRFFNGQKAVITWGIGHLVELAPPEEYKEEWKKWSLDTLPILPKQFKFQVAKDKRKQFNVVKKLLMKASEIIVATDCDREGENIARSIIKLSGASGKPTKRLWINSLEIDEIQKGFSNLKKGNDYLPLYEEAKTRQISDWLVGINASRLYTLLMQKKGLRGVYSVGRVQTPTLYLIYKRQNEVENFQSKPFYELVGDITTDAGTFNAKHKERFDQEEKAKELLQSHGITDGKNKGVIKSVEKQLKKSKAPKLHSLSTLQTKANKKWKYSPSEVLKIVQGLYEKKLVTYPRTDCHFITDNEFNYVKEKLSEYQSCLGIQFDVGYPNARKGYVDGAKVQEHYALIPTKQVAQIDDLSEKERNIYKEILSTTLSMFAPDYEFEETIVEVDVNGLMFHKTGKIEKRKGWKVLLGEESETKKDDEPVLPEMNEGDSCSVTVSIREGMTKPPKLFTEGNLIQVMKNAGKEVDDENAKAILKQTEGIGTEATRANIIDTLKHQEYIEIKKNTVYVTPKGALLCQAVDGTLLASAEMTAKWEQYLSKIGKNEGSQQTFLDTIEKFILSLLDTVPKQVENIKEQIDQATEKTFIGICLQCQNGKIEDKGTFYGWI